MVTPIPPAEEIIYERADSIHDRGQVIFITVLKIDEVAKRATRESHVFMVGARLHLHEVHHGPLARCACADYLSGAVQETHHLLAKYLVNAADSRSTGGGGITYATRQSDGHPFHEFFLRRQFLDTMWEIQDWTLSTTLREALAGVTRSRRDPNESAVLAMIFGGQ